MANICMVSDYFYPALGGIERHIRVLSSHLHSLGHKIVIITHTQNPPPLITESLPFKVYALDLPIVYLNTTFPSLYSNFYVFKRIFEEEEIDIVHGHQSMSNLCLEGIYHAKTMRLKTVFTEHSIFEEGGFENILVNSLSRFILRGNKCICVSYTSKEDVMSRIGVKDVHVIPNGVEREKFYSINNTGEITGGLTGTISSTNRVVLVMSRLVYRKGVDYLIKAIPIICKRNKNIIIKIAGDGPKKDEIEQMIDEEGLRSQVILVGEVPHHEVGDFLRSGEVFLNCSLTETFCMAILEAAMCGLKVVSTNVGGIHEVLPNKMIFYAKPSGEDLAEKVLKVIEDTSEDTSEEKEKFDLRDAYSWERVTLETERVYESLESSEDILKRVGKFEEFCLRFLIVMEFVWYKILAMLGGGLDDCESTYH